MERVSRNFNRLKYTMQPEQLGPFKIGRVLGRGGMGAVYEGVHIGTGAVAAVKVLLSTLENDNELRFRFEAEIDTLKRLRHPNIVRLFGFGEEQEMLYYVMELIEGQSLQQELKQHRLFQWQEVAKIGLEMCLALKHAHDRGIIHRDIKPANILLDQQGVIKLSDYGIAQFFGAQRITEAHSVVGTLEFMSPEQALANPIGPRSDLYSLGAVLYALLATKPPFIARNLPEIIRKHQQNTIESLQTIRLDVPTELEAIIHDLLKIHQEDRPSNAYLVAKRFQSLLQALSGNPDEIHVLPMTPESQTSQPQEPVRIPFNGDLHQTTAIRPSRGMVISNGIIDLGGVIVEDSSTGLVPTPKEKTSLAASFGRLGELDASNNQTETMTGFMPSEAEWMGDNTVDDIPTAPISRIERNDAAKQVQEGDRCAANLLSADQTQALTSLTPVSTCEDADASKWIPKSSSHVGTTKASPSSHLRHGEIVIEDMPAVRRSKDEPLPEISVFEALIPPKPEKKEVPEEKQPVRDNDSLTVNGFTSDSIRRPGEFPHAIAPPQSIFDSALDKKLDKKQMAAPVSAASEQKTDIAPKPVSEADSNRSASAPSRFVSVEDDDLDDYEDTSILSRPILSIQTILTSICLLVMGLVTWYLLQPVSPDTLYERIRQTVDQEDSEDGLSLTVLKQAKGNIEQFLTDHPQHPMADQVRIYKDELDLAEWERRLERKPHLFSLRMLTPVERAYMDAVSLAPSSPDRTVTKLKAFIDLYQTDIPHLANASDDILHHEKRLANMTDICVELAKRRLKKLEAEAEAVNAQQHQVLRKRLDDAAILEKEHPKRAEEIRRGIVELYQDHLWAKDIVEEARKLLEK
jgi:hypothetical protein